MFTFAQLTSGGFYTLKTDIAKATVPEFTININPAPKFQTDSGSGTFIETLLTVLPVMMNPNRINASRVLEEESVWLTGGVLLSDGSADYTVSFRGLLNTWADNPPTRTYAENQFAHSIGDVVQFDFTGLIRNMNATFIAATTQLTAKAGEALDATLDVLKVSLHSRAITAVADHSGTVPGTVKVTTSLAHDLTTGDTVDQVNTTDYDGSFLITVIDTTNYHITATFTSTRTGSMTDNTLHKYNSTTYPNLVGAIPKGNNFAEDATATYSVSGASVSGYSGLVAGLTVFAENTGGYTQTGSATTKVAGVAITSTTAFLFLAPTELIKATPAEAATGTNDINFLTPLTAQSSIQASTAQFAADAEASDTYVITLSPVPSAYFTGMRIIFKANTVNTDSATLNANGLGAKTIVKNFNATLADGDIAAGQLVEVVYDGTNFQMVSPVAVDLSDVIPFSAGHFSTFFDEDGVGNRYSTDGTRAVVGKDTGLQIANSSPNQFGFLSINLSIPTVRFGASGKIIFKTLAQSNPAGFESFVGFTNVAFTTAKPSTVDGKYFGFLSQAGALKGMVLDASGIGNLQLVDLSTTSNTMRELTLLKDGTASVKFFVDGVLKGTITTFIPTGVISPKAYSKSSTGTGIHLRANYFDITSF